MHRALLAFALLLGAGCTSGLAPYAIPDRPGPQDDPTDIDTGLLPEAPTGLEATLRVAFSWDLATDSLRMSAAGDEAQAGMVGWTCRLGSGDGAVREDRDLIPGEDRVFDYTDSRIAVGNRGTGALVIDDLLGGEDTYEFDRLSAAILLPDGHAALGTFDGRCLVWVVDERGPTPIEMPWGTCASGAAELDVGPWSDAVWLADGNLWRLEGGVAEVFAPGSGDRVAADRTEPLLYVALSGGTRLTAIRLDGSPAWQHDLGASITALTDLGTHGGVLASVACAGCPGPRLVGYAPDGTELIELMTESEASSVDVSDDGAVLGLAGMDTNAAFYDLVAL